MFTLTPLPTLGCLFSLLHPNDFFLHFFLQSGGCARLRARSYGLLTGAFVPIVCPENRLQEEVAKPRRKVATSRSQSPLTNIARAPSVHLGARLSGSGDCIQLHPNCSQLLGVALSRALGSFLCVDISCYHLLPPLLLAAT